ncbi:ArsR family transcriptional regulator [Marinitoga lauensis]
MVKTIAKNKGVCLCELQKDFPLDVSTLSRHLNMLKKLEL